MKNIYQLLSILFICVLILGFSKNILKAQSIELDTLERAFFVGGLSPSILSEGKIEVNGYSSIFSSWLAVKRSASDATVIDRLRLSEFSTNIEAYYGLSASGRWDLGLRLTYVRRRLDNAARSSPFRVLGGDDLEDNNVGVDKTYAGMREVGIRFRLLPFLNIPSLTINGGYSLSTIKEEESQIHLAADRNRFDLNLAYYISINNSGTSYYYFIMNNTVQHPSSINKQWQFNTSLSGFVVQRIAGRFVVYPGLSYTLSYKPPSSGDGGLIRTNQQVLGVLGLQYEPSQNVNLNISWAIPLLVESSNVLIDQVRSSYTFVSIGGRYVF